MDGGLSHEIRDLAVHGSSQWFQTLPGAIRCMRGCLGHLTLLQTPGAALWAGDLLHHVAESHLAKTSEESAGLKPHKCDAWNQTDSLLSPNIQDSDSANSSSYTAWELMAVWPCRLARELNATGQLRKHYSKMEIFFQRPPGFPMPLDHCPAYQVGEWSPAVPPTLEPLTHLLRGYSA